MYEGREIQFLRRGRMIARRGGSGMGFWLL